MADSEWDFGITTKRGGPQEDYSSPGISMRVRYEKGGTRGTLYLTFTDPLMRIIGWQPSDYVELTGSRQLRSFRLVRINNASGMVNPNSLRRLHARSSRTLTTGLSCSLTSFPPDIRDLLARSIPRDCGVMIREYNITSEKALIWSFAPSAAEPQHLNQGGRHETK